MSSTIHKIMKRKALLHVIGQLLIAVSIGSFFSAQLLEYSGLFLIIGFLLLLPLIADALKDKHNMKRRRR